jgi:hypothetical protein
LPSIKVGIEFDADAEPCSEVKCHVDIGAPIRAVGLQEAERRVIAGRADPQHPGRLNASKRRHASGRASAYRRYLVARKS